MKFIKAPSDENFPETPEKEEFIPEFTLPVLFRTVLRTINGEAQKSPFHSREMK